AGRCGSSTVKRTSCGSSPSKARSKPPGDAAERVRYTESIPPRGATPPMFDPDEAPQPALDAAAYDRLQATLAARGPQAAVDELITELRKADDHQALFYALLMKKRVELGVSPFPTGNATELPPDTHEAYEDGIRAAGRHVGGMLLERKEYAKAWPF